MRQDPIAGVTGRHEGEEPNESERKRRQPKAFEPPVGYSQQLARLLIEIALSALSEAIVRSNLAQHNMAQVGIAPRFCR